MSEEIRYLHMDIGDGKATAAYTVTGGRVFFTLAFCSPEDQFSRKIGRAIASGRMEKYGASEDIHLRDDTPPDRQIREHVEGLVERHAPSLPLWAWESGNA